MDAIVYDKVGKEAEKVREALYGIYPQETITDAAIASFDDGADSMPVKKLVAQIEPVQDLHGYDHPWPAGGGVNKFNYANCGVVGLSKNDGLFTNTLTDDGREYFGFTVQLLNSQNVIIKGQSNNNITSAGRFSITIVSETEFAKIRIKHSGRTQDLYIDYNISGTAETYTVSLNVIGYNPSTVGGLSFNDVMIEVGSTMSAYSPYSNICPISGWTGAEITGTWKNLFGGVYNVFFPLHFNVDTQITASADTRGGSGNIQIAFYDSNQSQIDYWGLDTEGLRDKKTFTYPATAYYVKFIRTESTNYQIELGSAATDFEPYTGNQISVTFPSGAGTVYGGTLTLNPDRTGTLVVDRAVADLGNIVWSALDARNRRYSNDLSGVIKPLTNMDTLYPQFVSEQYKSIPNNTLYTDTSLIGITQNVSSIYIRTGSDALPEGKLVYPIASPQTITLTATEVSGILTTLYGTNNIWADTGNIKKLTYRADLGKYIDSHITTAVANALNA